jgi:hypothetical protein
MGHLTILIVLPLSGGWAGKLVKVVRVVRVEYYDPGALGADKQCSARLSTICTHVGVYERYCT